MRQYAHQQVFSTGDWWDVEAAPHLGEPWLFRRVYVAEVPHTEQETLLAVFVEMLKAVTRDGGRKRTAGVKLPWWKDVSHEPAIFSHLNKWKHGEQRDPDSGAHPLTHLAWRALAIAYQDTYGMRDPDPMRCTICGGWPYDSEGAFTGTGDGTGQKFAHKSCYDKKAMQSVILPCSPELHETATCDKHNCCHCEERFP